MRLIYRLAFRFAVALLCFVVPIQAYGAGPGQIGGPPTLGGERLDPSEDIRQLGEAIVIGRGEAFNGPVEIVAYDTTIGLCVDVDHPRQGDSAGGCPVAPPPNGQMIAIDHEAFAPYGRHLQHRYSEVGGPLSPGVPSVRVSFKRHRGRRTVDVIVARPDDALLERLHQDRAFGYFAGVGQGCTRFRKARAIALDGSGALLAKARGFRLPAFGCNDHPKAAFEVR